MWISEGSFLEYEFDLVGETVVHEWESVALKKFILELHPVQPQSVQKALHRVHAHQDTECGPQQHRKP